MTTQRIAEAFGHLIERAYDRGENTARDLKIHLAIPPFLYPCVQAILWSEKVAELSINARNVVPSYIDTIWLDKHLRGTCPNLPWFAFADEQTVLSKNPDPEYVYYSTGTAP